MTIFLLYFAVYVDKRSSAWAVSYCSIMLSQMFQMQTKATKPSYSNLNDYNRKGGDDISCYLLNWCNQTQKRVLHMPQIGRSRCK